MKGPKRFLLSGVILLAGSIGAAAVSADDIVFEVSALDEGGRSVHSPWDTLARFTPSNVAESTAVMHPMIRYVCFFNATGGKVDDPGSELYEEDTSGNPVYHFDRLTAKLDTVLAAGLIPYLALSGSPLALASDPSAISPAFNTNTSPPRDLDRYHDFIRALFEHLDGVYGAAEPASWRYRFMTEPDNTEWWTGTMEEWFVFYDTTVSAARAANPDVVIEPANFMIIDTPWVETLAQRIASGTFAVPGESPVTPSVLRFSFYRPWRIGQTSGPWDLAAEVEAMRSRLSAYPELRDLPVAVDEGYIGMDENDEVMYARLDGTELGGAYFALLTHALVSVEAAWGALWTPGMSDVPPPARNVLNLFEEHVVGGRLLDSLLVSGTPDGDNVAGALAVRPAGGGAADAAIMLYTYNRSRGAVVPETAVVRILDMPRSEVEVTVLVVDREHGNYSVQWLEDSAHIARDFLGYPVSPYDLNPLQGLPVEGIALWETNRTLYRELSRVGVLLDAAAMAPDGAGMLEISVPLPSHGVAFVIVEAPSAAEDDGEQPVETDADGVDASVDPVDAPADLASDTAADDGAQELVDENGGGGGCGCRLAG